VYEIDKREAINDHVFWLNLCIINWTLKLIRNPYCFKMKTMTINFGIKGSGNARRFSFRILFQTLDVSSIEIARVAFSSNAYL